MKILGIGEAVVDHISVVERDASNGDQRVLDSRHDAGGPVLAGLILLARLGNDCTFVTAIGNDSQGEFIRKTMQREGITLSTRMRSSTKCHTVLVNPINGERDKFRDDSMSDPIRNLSPAHIASFDLIIMDRHERAAFKEVIKHKRSDTIVITDPSTEVSSFTMDMVRHSTCPIIPIESLAALAHEQTLAEALETFHRICRKSFVVTLGDMGSLLYENHQVKHITPHMVTTIDKTGAGDIYRGAFAYGLGMGWSLAACASFSNTAAALQCTQHGNAAAVPTKQALELAHADGTHRHVELLDVEESFAHMSEAAARHPHVGLHLFDATPGESFAFS